MGLAGRLPEIVPFDAFATLRLTLLGHAERIISSFLLESSLQSDVSSKRYGALM